MCVDTARWGTVAADMWVDKGSTYLDHLREC